MIVCSRKLLNDTLLPFTENIILPKPVQVMPSVEYAIVLVPEPTAVHLNPLQFTARPDNEKVVVPKPDQVMPSVE